ncbi:hypothetical protein RVN05_06935 [Salmonella enterica subsp. enterica serovar Thompson]|uniref:Ead/Ea22-like family protein n=8 Tax=Salmonella TaxID=590 RepID=A0A5X4DG74_SALTH|nr:MULTISPECIES: hypothetical protein [Salmonella]EAA3673922.1 hypothetical protein [Salmonella enterica subsp. enterica serovar Braenderup]EBS5651226.1 hypothetical protein [Salmonella enterica subsp. enterica serovar Galiema]EBY4075549.1 hypothetical protein [Salmonella enterica subsp. enterica serovar Potsdam]ECS8594350.1 hypothetical protein [Salmonella enterica subsp. enterica serovar Rissen]EDI9386999.1 hypothetical protein [Salmonella enterica subsp. enterica serovar Bareilly]EEO701968
MKEVTLIEMDGFLKGKCIPRDLKVNETNAEYLVRKFAEAEAKCAALAAENAALKKSDVEFNEYCRRECEDVGDTWEDDFTDTPATDAFLDEVRAQAFNDLCSAFVKDATVVGLDDGDIVTVKEATDALLHCADQLRKGVHS